MQILIDSQIYVWWLEQNKRLKNKALQLMVDPHNTIYFSAASIWELCIKQSLGRFQGPENFAEELKTDRITLLPVKAEHAQAVAELPWHHRDPFDRMLVAQAKTEALCVLTADQKFSEYDVKVICNE